jgi:hypothetical protein
MVRQAPASFRVELDQAELRKLVADLKALEGGKKQVTALRKNLQAAAAPMKRQVQANASWSSRIPGAVGVLVRFTAKKVGVSVFISRKKAPHARPIENGGKQGVFRHPVFGQTKRRGRYYVTAEQPARPFFFNEMARHMPEVERACLDAIDTAARDAGFR